MYILEDEGVISIIFDFVDDFIFTGSDKNYIDKKIAEMRVNVQTTEPVWNAKKVLGLEIKRDWEKHIICVTMVGKICEMHKAHIAGLTEFTEKKQVLMPMPASGYIIKDEEFNNKKDAKAAYLDAKGIHLYLVIVGGLIWIAGVRFDILYVVMYLTWFTKAPRQHHLDMARYCLEYLYRTRYYPLVLGGRSQPSITGYTDASLGTATKGRSTVGHAIKLDTAAGAVLAKAKTTLGVHLSSFEAELDGMTNALKSICRVRNILTELHMKCAEAGPKVYSDNQAMLEFVKGQGVAKNVMHMELRMWYIREKFSQDNINFEFMPGDKIPVDKLTKIEDRKGHSRFTYDILGHSLLYDDWTAKFDFEEYITSPDKIAPTG